MAVNYGGAAGGAITGAKMGSALGPWGTAIGALAGGAMGAFGGGGDDVGLEDMRSPEQKRAAAMLLQLGETGSAGGLTLGERYTGPLGFYEQGTQGLAGGTALENLLRGAYSPTSDIGRARSIYEGFADLGKFDPSDPRSGYAAFNRALAKSGKEAESALEREAAIQGRRYGTAIGGEKADLAENLNLQRQQRLAEMFQSSQQFAALGAQGFKGLANQVAEIAGLNINYDDYQRQLKNQEAQDRLMEFKRARNEELERIGILQTEANRNPYMGISSIPGSPSPFSQLTGSVLGSFGKQVGTDIAKDGIGSIFGSKTKTTSNINLPGGGTGGFFDQFRQ
jgi:hypothetical protein